MSIISCFLLQSTRIFDNVITSKEIKTILPGNFASTRLQKMQQSYNVYNLDQWFFLSALMITCQRCSVSLSFHIALGEHVCFCIFLCLLNLSPSSSKPMDKLGRNCIIRACLSKRSLSDVKTYHIDFSPVQKSHAALFLIVTPFLITTISAIQRMSERTV